jgi:poly-gamma-glutamate capsule biosynthesis protein CapA/YwtB (metallophosphatase superfamily)
MKAHTFSRKPMPDSPSNEIWLYAVGDIGPSRPDPSSLFVHVRDELRRADVAFCQLELCITQRGQRLPQCRHTDRTSARTAPALREAGFDVVSFAGNHCMDWGVDGLTDTIAALKGAELQVVGVGENIAVARRPALMTAKGQRIAYLAYSSILPIGYWAEESRPGCAPMRAWTLYEQIEHDQPGTPARIHTFPNRDDLQALREDVARARALADFVVVSLHWGIHFIPGVIADYQRDVGRAAIDAGADIILGHHAHILKGVDIYNGKPILYSLCNFAMDLPMDQKHANSKGFREIQKLHPDWQPNFDITYNFPPDSRYTVMVKTVLRDGKYVRTSLLPVFIGPMSQPELLSADDPRFEQVAAYLERYTASQGLNAVYERQGAELVLGAS